MALSFAVALSILLSPVAFVLIGLDKRAAARGRWRTSEATLHLVELLGGWPGSLAAQRLFRHKTAKLRYRAVFWIAAVANVLIVAMAAWISA